MKRLIVFLACSSAFAFTGGAIAQSPGKANILHCGCVTNAEGTLAMAYISANVSSKARGHLQHVAGSLDSCFNGVDTFVDFQRTGGDCLVSGSLPGLPACTTEAVGTICGQAVAQ
jgi:hypothetical protein